MSSVYALEASEVAKQLRNTKSGRALQELGPAVRKGLAVQTCAHCIKHNIVCEMYTAELHIAGSPCTDWSNFGCHNTIEGKTDIDWLAWIGLRVKLQEAQIQMANVIPVDINLVMDFLGHLYNVEYTDVSSEQFGWPVRRPRKYIVLKHKWKTLPNPVELRVWAERFHRLCCISRGDFLASTEHEVSDDLK